MTAFDRSRYDFGGRIREPKEAPSPDRLTELPCQRMAFVYKRLSTHEQVKKSLYSIQMQDELERQAQGDGYTLDLSVEEVQRLKDTRDYPGFYRNGQVHIEERDLGISGTVGQDRREGLACLIQMVGDGLVESIYVIHVSRLFRDQTLIDGLTFGELCKEKGVILVVPNMRLNLQDKMHMRIYRLELERAADELELMSMRLGGARELKAKQGYFAAGLVALGYILDLDRESPTYEKFIPYEPHAEIVRLVFHTLLKETSSPYVVSRKFQREGIFIPPFQPEIAPLMNNRSALREMNQVHGGYRLTPTVVRRIATNPVYIGWWIWGGQVVRQYNHEPIIDEEVFWAVQERLARGVRRGRASYSSPLPLTGLLWCAAHPEPLGICAAPSRPGYMCQNEYALGLADHACFGIVNWAFDDSIARFVVSQCSLSGYTEKVLQELTGQYEETKAKAKARKRAYSRLTREIENLRENLAQTTSKRQVQLILEGIEEKLRERDRLAEVTVNPTRPTLTPEQIEMVRDFLSNIESRWDELPGEMQNEFLRIVLERILIYPEGDRFRAVIYWRTGLEQELLIHRPPYPFSGDNRWTPEEDEIVEKHYATMPQLQLEKLLPNRTWEAIHCRAKAKGIRRERTYCSATGKYRRWTREEDELVKRYVRGELNLGQVMERTGRTKAAIDARISRKKLGPKPRRFPREVKWEVMSYGGNGSEGQFS